MSVSVLILTGQSGSGKSTAIRVLEDHGFFCVDNIPTGLVVPLVELSDRETNVSQLALVMDVREPHFIQQVPNLVTHLRRQSKPFRLVYLEATEATLLRRYSETRRRHPLDDGCGLRHAIAHEREILAPLRELADDTLDTSSMSPHELRTRVLEQLVHAQIRNDLRLALMSFGFKYGIPLDADIVLDVRFLPNPYFQYGLREKTGLDAAVREYVNQSPDGQDFLTQTIEYLRFLLPRYQREGKRYLTIAVGCTGGQHRSVAIAEELALRFSDRKIPVDRRHRDIREQQQ